ncbi:GNAT family N-acetyltransferase [Actinoplanes sp. ATCC 53533]|uniref:GNAT family N-acetyltransferase n=1 Tax=Actinoplanes sp. ATCC 53533 TaxID=1288362 RepID=UPI000F7691C0|nr:GNAT family N-acetyltransferase [Actinoplanes sp. ATCC 53533]RSM51634.1 GNAT family N-acetyltransferase [Actinoplanes sp. ATCC 53533]
MDDSGIIIRTGDADDWPAVFELLSFAFHEQGTPEARDSEGSVVEPERTLVVQDGDAIVGHTAAFTRELTVPGAIVPAAHVSLVSVAPTHKRRGLLTRMMHRQLRDIAAAGREPIATLWASETKIYPRFGYGPAARRLHMEIMMREVRPPAGLAPGSADRLRLVEPKDAIAELAKVYERVRPERTGWSSRDDRWWRYVLADLESQREGATSLHGLVYDTPKGPTGYALWRTKDRWNRHGPDSEVQVREVVADDPVAYAALWNFLLTIDLARSATVSFAAVDEPLQYLVDEPRRLGSALSDGLWIRITDLPKALAARSYAAPVDVVLEVTDPLLEQNTGRWRLTAGPDGGATCRPTTDPADLACTVLELGSAYLGATSLAALAAAGTVRELTPGTLRRASVAFGWHRMPNPTEVF